MKWQQDARSKAEEANTRRLESTNSQPETWLAPKAHILGFHAQESADKINVHREAQELLFEFTQHVQPTFKDFPGTTHVCQAGHS